MSRTFDAIIIGTGQAGPPLAKRLASAGMKVCQRRLKFPQKCRSKIPQFPGTVISRASDLPSRFSAAAHGVLVAGAA